MAVRDDIYRIADRLTPTARKQFLDAVAKLKTKVTIDILAEGVQRRGLPRPAVRAFDDFEKRLMDTQGATIQLVWERVATGEEKRLAARLGLSARFDMVNPAAVEAARTRTAMLIRGVSNETRVAVRQIIARSIEDGIAPRVAAQQIRSVVGLTSRQASAVMNYRKQLRAAGATQRAASQAAYRYAQRSLNERALTIARTENIRASVMGQLDVWNGARSQGLLDDNSRKLWITTPDERLCPICAGLDNEEASLSGLFTGQLDGPPAHPSCRCTVGLTFPNQRRR